MVLSSLVAEVSSSTTSTASSSAGTTVAILLGAFVYAVLLVTGFWRTLAKGGESGPMALLMVVTCLLPIAYLPMLRLIGRPAWWVVLLYIPIVNIVVLAIISIDVARSFGRSTGFGIGLWLLGFVFYPILGLGSATYQGPSVRSAV